MSISASYPEILPSLLLDFANSKAVDPRITFTRSTTAKYYDGVTTAKAEENLLRYSQEFDNAAWNPAGLTITANTTSAPDGTTTADTINEGTATGLHNVQQTGFPYVSGTTYTQSVFAKADTATVVQMVMQSTAFGLDAFANYDLSSGVLGTVGASATATITSVGSGWYRITLTATATSTITQNTGFIFLCNNNTAAARALSYTGTSRQLFLWGVQFEQRSAVTAYTPTTTQPITNYIPVLQTAAAGVPRIDHDPVTGECLGLLIEQQRTNLLTYSEQFNSAAWTKIRASISSNVVVAPDGTVTGDKFIPTSVSGNHYVSQSLTSGTYIASCFAKKEEYRYFQIAGTSTIQEFATFDLETGEVAAVGTAFSNASMQSVGGGWYRCSVVFVTTGTLLAISASNASTSWLPTYTGDDYSGIYIWGAQLEVGAFPTSYIPTVATQETRNADAAIMTGTNFSSWFNNGAGTLYGEFARVTTSTTGRVFQFDDGTGNNRLYVGGSTDGGLVVIAGGSSQASPLSGTLTVGVFSKIAGAYKVNDFAVSTNGSTVGVDPSGVVPVVDRARIGVNESGNPYLNGTIKKIAYYPQRLTDAQLQALTA